MAQPAPADVFATYEIERRWPILLLSAITFVLSLPLFAPWSAWPLGYVVFVPWLLAVCQARRTGWVYAASYLLGAAFFLTHWRWLFSTTPPGYFAGALFFALHFPLAAWLVRHLYRRRGISPTLAFPIAWTLTEMLRSRGPLGFPWFLLGHSQIRLLPMIQIADLTGVSGISFVVAMVNGWFVHLLLRAISLRRGAPGKPVSVPEAQVTVPSEPRTPVRGPAHHLRGGFGQKPSLALRALFTPLLGTAVMLIVVTGTLAYGYFRLGTMKMVEGPKLAVVQGDFLMSPNYDPTAPNDATKAQAYFDLMAKAAAREPDLIVLPETPWSMYINRELREMNQQSLREVPTRQMGYWHWLVGESKKWHNEFVTLASQFGCHIVTGSMSQEKQPKGAYPAEHRYNSAFVYSPDAPEPQRYDKIHLVMFGEFVPFRYNRLLRPLYVWLNSITPFGEDGFEYSLTAGRQFSIFPLRERQGTPVREYHFGITICYEDVIPHLFRRFVLDAAGKKRIDFMLNISNDGWFGHGSQQPQHLVNCAFRAVENRVGIARAVNTGVSGFIAPDGSWYDLVGNGDGPRAGGTGQKTARVRINHQATFYSAHGDVFGFACALMGLTAGLDALLAIWRARRRSAQSQGASS